MMLDVTPWDALHSDVVAALVDEVVGCANHDPLDQTVRALVSLLERVVYENEPGLTMELLPD